MTFLCMRQWNPFVDIKTVRDVIIITSFNGQGEVADNTDTNNASSNGG